MSVTQERSLPEFERIDLRGVGKVVVRQAEVASVVVQAPENVIDRLRTEVRERELIIGLRWWPLLFAWASVRDIEIHVAVPRLRGLVVSGAGKIVTPEPIEAEDLDLKLSGAGSLEIKVSARKIVARLSGAGSITAAGNAESLEVALTGAGRFDGSELKATAVRIRSAGAGETTVFAADSLDVTLTGAGTVRYRGAPKVSSRISGLGSLEAED